MRIARSILDAATPRRVLAVVLVGAFAEEVVSIIAWLAEGLAALASVRALAFAALVLVLEVALVYLALRGLRSVLSQRRGPPVWRRDPGPEAEDFNTDASVPARRRLRGGRSGSEPERH